MRKNLEVKLFLNVTSIRDILRQTLPWQLVKLQINVEISRHDIDVTRDIDGFTIRGGKNNSLKWYPNSPTTQPYNSTLIDIQLYHVIGWNLK